VRGDRVGRLVEVENGTMGGSDSNTTLCSPRWGSAEAKPINSASSKVSPCLNSEGKGILTSRFLMSTEIDAIIRLRNKILGCASAVPFECVILSRINYAYLVLA